MLYPLSFLLTIALTQNDIKRVLAYSTVSQLGYMVMALGVGAYKFAFFHLITGAVDSVCSRLFNLSNT
ncbi:MAG: hypothetical protein MZV64_36380 [Ignavibacteriales bacterium]|nr:hypothetical protein [Ignavibacteriales bacterium]